MSKTAFVQYNIVVIANRIIAGTYYKKMRSLTGLPFNILERSFQKSALSALLVQRYHPLFCSEAHHVRCRRTHWVPLASARLIVASGAKISFARIGISVSDEGHPLIADLPQPAQVSQAKRLHEEAKGAKDGQ